MLRSRMLRVILITAAAGLTVPAALMAQRAPRVPETDLAALPAVQQTGTVDIRGETLPLYRGREGVRARIGSRGGVLRLADHDLRVVVPAGGSSRGALTVQTVEAWPSKWQPLRRVGPALRIVGDLGDRSSPLLFDMEVEDLRPRPRHRLVLVGVHAPDADARAIKIAAPVRGFEIDGKQIPGREARRARARARATTEVRAAGASSLRARAREGNQLRARAGAARALRSRSGGRVMPARPYEVWTGTHGGQRVTIVSAFYDPRTDRVTAEFDGTGSFQSFAFGWVPEDVLESRSLRKRPGRVKAAGARMLRAEPREADVGD